MKQKPSEILRVNRQKILDIVERYKKDDIVDVKIFGSVARGEDTERSDIDFLFIANSKTTLLTMCGLCEELRGIFEPIPVGFLDSRRVPKSANEIITKAIPI